MNPGSIEAKKQNILRMLREIYDHPDISRKELGQRFGLSASTVTLAINPLLKEGLLIESGQEESAAGRKARLLRVNAAAGSILVIHPLDNHAVRLRLCDLCGTRLAEQTLSPPTPPTADTYTARLTDAAKTFLASLQMPQPLAAAVINPGVMNPDGTADLPVFGWDAVDLTALPQELGIPVYCDTILHLLGGYEVRQSGINGRQIYLSLEPGVGMNCYEDGRAVTSRNLLFGEIGHISMHENGPVCYCGNRGCLEYYCGIPGIIARMEAAAAVCPVLAAFPLTPDALPAAASRGSEAAKKLLEEIATELARAIVTIRNMLDPDQIIISGRLWQMAAIQEPVRRLVYSRTMSRTREPLRLSSAALPPDRYEVGVCHYVFNRLIEQIL